MTHDLPLDRVGESCDFPTCRTPAEALNRARQPMCGTHLPVVIAPNGSDVNDRHTEGGHG